MALTLEELDYNQSHNDDITGWWRLGDWLENIMQNWSRRPQRGNVDEGQDDWKEQPGQCSAPRLMDCFSETDDSAALIPGQANHHESCCGILHSMVEIGRVQTIIAREIGVVEQ